MIIRNDLQQLMQLFNERKSWENFDCYPIHEFEIF